MGRIQNLDKLMRRLDGVAGKRAEEFLGQVLFEGAESVAVYAQTSITRGAVSGKDHVPSAPGEPPNNDSGVLAGNIGAHHLDRLEKAVIADAPYAAALEKGSKRKAGTSSRSFAGKTSAYGPNRAKQGPVKVEFGDSQTEARPFMRPARDAKKKEIRKKFARAVSAIVKGAAD